MATAWIHRAKASDILIRFTDLHEAYSYLLSLAKRDGASNIRPEPSELPPNGYDVAQTASVQFILHGQSFDATEWSENIVVLFPEEALYLGDSGEPMGFIPGETERPWYPEYRSHQELDEEIDTHMGLNSVAEAYLKAYEYRDHFSNDEWTRIQDTEDRFIEDGHYENAVNHWNNVVARATQLE
jgi:hypothetical protein